MASSSASASASAPDVINVIRDFIPIEYLSEVIAEAFKYASVVKQFFILQAGISVKMRRPINKTVRNLQCKEEYLAWVKNLNHFYPNAAINKYMLYTTKTGTRQYTARDIWRRFVAGLEKFHNVYCSTWIIILQGQISGKSWKDIWIMFVKEIVNKP